MRYYCLFHTSGFRTFLISDKDAMVLDDSQMVTSENRHDYPVEASKYMNQSGVNFLYQYINEETITMVVNEIPSIKRDTGGNDIPCAFQIIASKDEEEQLNKIASGIKKNLENDFKTFYSDLFSMRGGLKIEGRKLYAYIENFITDANITVTEKPEPYNPPQTVSNSDTEQTSLSKKKFLIGILILLILLFSIVKTCQNKPSSTSSSSSSSIIDSTQTN